MRENGENSRQTIMDAALGLFSARGYDAVGVNEIAAAAGITKPTLYHFFGSKEGLFTTILRENYAQLDNLLEKSCAYAPDPDQYHRDIYPVLLETARTYFRFAQARPDFYLLTLALTFAPPTSQPAAMAEPFHLRQYATVEGMFRQFSAVHTGLGGKEPRLAMTFLSMVNANIASWYRGRGTLEEADAAGLTNQFMHGIFA